MDPEERLFVQKRNNDWHLKMQMLQIKKKLLCHTTLNSAELHKL